MRILTTVKKLIVKTYGGERLIKYLRAKGMKIGENCRIFCDISTSESYLVEIGNGTTISGNVTLITHDASIQKVIPDKTDIFGKIKIGNNCFIGNGATIMYGVTLPDNTIVATGSVVTKSIHEEGCVLAGNPAKVVSNCEDFAKKNADFAVNIHGLNGEEKRKLLENDKILVKR